MIGHRSLSIYVQSLRARLAENLRKGHLKVCPICNGIFAKSDLHPRGDCDREVVRRVMKS